MTTWFDAAGCVTLPDGRRVRGARLRQATQVLPPPDFTVLLAARRPAWPTGPARWIAWPDFGVPASTADALDALREAFERSAGERVLLACRGGVGRTGTALSVLALMAGISAEEAVPWVRERYHPRAVETRRQRRWILSVAAQL